MKPWALQRLLGAALLGLLASFGASADSPANGAVLFANNCAVGCHGASPLTTNRNRIFNGRNARSVPDAAIASNIGGMGRLRARFPAGGTELADVAAYLGNTPTTLTFGPTTVGDTAAAQTVTVSASLKVGNSIGGLVVTTSGDFARAGGTCAVSVGTGLNCTLLVTFTPSVSGSRTGTLSLSHSNTRTPIEIALTGTGVAAPVPVASITPSSLSFAATAIGDTTAAQNVNVANTGNAPLAISTIDLGNPADFVIAGGTCNAGGSVAAGSSCTIPVAFKPAPGALGARSGSLSVAHNAANSPGSVSLGGTATAAAAPVASLTAALAFGSVNLGTTSTAQTATLSNMGTAPLILGTLSTGSAEFAVGGGTCAPGGSVAAGASCSINLSFTPSVAGARSANLVVTHNAAGGQSSASLSGTGVALNPVIGVSPTTLNFSQTIGTTSTAQTATVSNTGNAALAIAALSLAGAQAAEFQIATGTTCVAGGSVAAGGSCAVKLAFSPAAAGARSASLTIAHNAAGSPTTVTLNGSGTTAPQPAISLNASTLTFAAQAVGSTSASQSVTVSNSGSALLTFSGLTMAGTAAADFSRGGTCTAGGTLSAGASCSVSYTFTPGAAGARSATLTLASDAGNGNAVLSLLGTGAGAATPRVELAPGALAFGNQTTGIASTARSVTLTNRGAGTLNIADIAATAGFGVSHPCGASLAAGAACTLAVTFTPAAVGAVAGSVSVVSNAAGSPHSVSLSGSGVAASPVLAWVPATVALDFGDVSVGAAPSARSLTLRNQGPGAVTLQQIRLAGAQAAEFSLASTGTCAIAASLGQGASCTLDLAFQPGAVGPRGATLQVVSSGTDPPDVGLSGTGTAMAMPAVAVVPLGLSFSVPAGRPAEAQTLTLQSTGNAVLRVSGARIASGSFTLAAAAVNGCPATPFDMLPGQRCVLEVGWSSTAPGTETGTIEIDTSAGVAPIEVAIQAERAEPAGVLQISNVGAGGCSVARGDSLADPTLWWLVLLAALVLWRRRAKR